MKYLFSVCLVVFLLFSMGVVTACSSSQPAPQPAATQAAPAKPAPTQAAPAKPAAGVLELKFNTQNAIVGASKEVTDAWANFVAVKSKGKAKLSFFPLSGLVPAGEEYTAVKKGMVEIAAADSLFLRGQIVANQAICLPGTVSWPGAIQSTLMHMDLFSRFKALQDEFKDVKVLFFLYGGPTQIQTCKKAVRTLEDLKGLNQIEIGGYSADAMKLLGTSPLSFPFPEMYDALTKGVADGVSINFDATNLFYKDAINYSTECSLVQPSLAFIIMNTDVYNKMQADPDLKDVFSPESCMKINKLWNYTRDRGDRTGRQKLDEKHKSKGLSGVYVLPQTEKDRWTSTIAPITKQWEKEVGAAGPEISKAVKEIAPKYAWNNSYETENEALLQEWKNMK